jgi:PKD repeat protein
MSTSTTIRRRIEAHAQIFWLALTIVLIVVLVVPVQAALNPDFTGTPRSGVSPLVVQFTDASTGPVDQWVWDFGDGNTSSKQNPQYTYNEPGTFTVKLDISNASGEQATITQKDFIVVEPPTISDPLTPDFTGTPRSGVSPLVVQFTDASTGPVDQWVWDFGDGNTSSKQNPQYTYNEPGTFTVKLDISNASGEQATITQKDFITVESPAIAEPLAPDFTAEPRSGIGPLTVQFTDTSTGPVDRWIWDFGDGNTSSKQNPQYKYNEPGTFTVKLDISNASGEQATITQKDFITVEPVPAASELIPNFTGTPRSGASPLTVQFTDKSTGFVEPITYHWDFGDGNTSSKQNPLYTFTEPGLYSLTITIGQADGSLATLMHKDYITVTTPPVAGELIPEFNATPRSGASPFTVQFTDTSTGFVEPITYLWDFGDGNTSSKQNPLYTYNEAGSYTIKLDVSNASGEQATISKNNYIKVTAVPPVLPVTDFFGIPTSGNAPLTVTFTDLTTNTPTSWNWSFGDDSLENATIQNPVHSFAAAGNYTVSLIATNANGSNSQTRSEYINVIPAPVHSTPPVADFSGKPTSGVVPLTVSFTDLSTNTPTSWNWVFGDNSLENATQQNPVHTYTNPGNYTVSLKATNGDGSDTQIRTEYIKVNAVSLIPPVAVPPIADFSGKPTSGDSPLTVLFKDLSTNAPTSWNWSFGDDSTENATQQNPVHTYTNPGNYTVSLNATNADGSDIQIRTDYIKVNSIPVSQPIATPPIADFSGKPTSGDSPLTVSFKDLSTNAPTSWNWVFGDDSLENATQQNPVHTYTNPGNYTVSLNATNADGSDMQIRTEYVKINAVSVSPPVAEFSGDPKNGIAPLTVTFTDLSTNAPTSWNWSFGDYSIENSTEQNPLHTYTNPGNYTVSLNVTNADGSNIKVWSDYITISEIPVTPLIPELLVPNFIGLPTSGPAPLAVQFNDTSTGLHDQWEWNFGDGNTSSEQNPLYTYNKPGSYSVVLNVSQTGGDSESKIQEDYITVVTPLIPIPLNQTLLVSAFTGTPTTGPAPLSVQFNDTSTGPHDQWEWNFGDGNTSSEQNPLYVYNKPGSYSVRLNVSQAGGDLGSTTQEDYIKVTADTLTPPIADFSGEPTSGVAPLTVIFTDLSTNMPTSWNWSFGDGSLENATEQNPVHIFTTTGNYTVSLNATNAAGLNVTTKTNFITVTAVPAGPVTDFSGTPTSGVAPLTVQFTDTSTGFVNPITYYWDFGDGNTSTERNPSHTYKTDTQENYTVILNVTGNYGQTNSMIKSGFITIDIPTIEFVLSDPSSDQSLLLDGSISSDQSIPQSQSISMGKSVHSQSIPHDISFQNGLLAATDATEIDVHPPQVNNWLLYNGENTKNLNMQIRSNNSWEVKVRDNMDGKPDGTQGKMAEYNTSSSAYIYPNGKHLNNFLHVISSSGNDVELSKDFQQLLAHQIIENEKGHWIEHPISLSQIVGGGDSSLEYNKYRIVIAFEASLL